MSFLVEHSVEQVQSYFFFQVFAMKNREDLFKEQLDDITTLVTQLQNGKFGKISLLNELKT